MDGAGHAAQLVFERGRFNEILLLACGIEFGFIGGENGGNACGAEFVGGFPQVGFEAAEEGLGFGV